MRTQFPCSIPNVTTLRNNVPHAHFMVRQEVFKAPIALISEGCAAYFNASVVPVKGLTPKSGLYDDQVVHELAALRRELLVLRMNYDDRRLLKQRGTTSTTFPAMMINVKRHDEVISFGAKRENSEVKFSFCCCVACSELPGSTYFTHLRRSREKIPIRVS